MFSKAKLWAMVAILVPYLLGATLTLPGVATPDLIGQTRQELVFVEDKADSIDKNIPHLILNFDVNSTLIATDLATGRTLEDGVLLSIAEMVFWRWDKRIDTPISYYSYLKDYIYPDPKIFKANKANGVRKIFEKMEEVGHPDFAKAQAVYKQSVDLLSNQSGLVFPSFYKLLSYLEEQGISYTLALRTFGFDGEVVAKEIAESALINFDTPVKMKEDHLDQENAPDLYSYLKQGPHRVIQDDYNWWSSHKEHSQYGKSFPIDLEDFDTLSLFFDDNANRPSLDPEVNILNPYDAFTGKKIDPAFLIRENKIFPVKMLEAVTDEDYFIKLVQKALYTHLDQKRSLQPAG